MQSCMTCKRLETCNKKEKSPSYSCIEFVPRSKQDISMLWGDGLELDKLIAKDKKEKEVRGNASIGDTPGNELDLISTLDTLFDPRSQQMFDLEIDDREFKEFPNFYQFCVGEHGANSPLWARQAYLALTLLNEFCPTCSHPKYSKHIKDFPLTMDPFDVPRYLQLMEYGRCPKCGKSKFDHYKSGRMSAYNEACIVSGQRIGKSTITALLLAYLTHKMVKIPNPSKMFGLLKTLLTGTMIALTYDKAVQLLWTPYKQNLLDIPWFQDYHAMLRQTGERKGQELIKFGNTLHYLHKGIFVHPSGPNKKTLRGATRFATATDEEDFFLGDAEGGDQDRMNGVEVYTSMKNSMITVRAAWKDLTKQGRVHLPNAYMLGISSPSSIRGPLTTRALSNLDKPGRIYAVHLPTWEVHPKLTKKMLLEEFASDPAKFERDFGANPPMADSPFLTIDQAQMMQSTRPNAIDYTFIVRKAANGAMLRAAKVTRVREQSTVLPGIMALDAGYRYNSFSLAIGNYYVDKDGNRSVHFPVIAEVIPDASTSIDFHGTAKHLLYPLIEAFNVQVVVADRWNSLKMLHDIDARYEGRVRTEQYSLKYRDFFLIKSYIESGALTVPRTEARSEDELSNVLRPDLKAYPFNYAYRPADHLFLQCCTVKDALKEVTKGESLTDDIWRCIVLGSYFLLDEVFCAENLKESKQGRKRVGLGAYASLGGGMTFGVGPGGHMLGLPGPAGGSSNGGQDFSYLGASSMNNPFAGRTPDQLYQAMFSNRLTNPNTPSKPRDLRSHVRLPRARIPHEKLKK